MLSIGEKKKQQIHSFPKKLAALNSENIKGLWKRLLRALSSAFWVYTCVKWKVDLCVCVCVCVKLQIYFLHAGKSEVCITIQLFLIQQKCLCMRAFHISYKWYGALVSDFPSDSSFQPHPRTWHLTQPRLLDLGLRSWQFWNNDWNRLESLELKEMFISVI